MKKLTKENIRKLYDLANIEVTDKEIDNFEKLANQIANDIEKIKNIDTTGLEPAYYCIDNSITYIREDEEIENINKKDVILNAPEQDGDYITIAKVVE